MQSDEVDLEFQQPGVLINTNNTAYADYMKRSSILSGKDDKISELSSRIDFMNDQINKLFERLDK